MKFIVEASMRFFKSPAASAAVAATMITTAGVVAANSEVNRARYWREELKKHPGAELIREERVVNSMPITTYRIEYPENNDSSNRPSSTR